MVRVGLKEGTYFANPTEQEREFSDLDLVVATGREGVVMLEAGANQVEEEKFLKGIEFGVKEGEKIVEFLDQLRKKWGKKKISFVPFAPDEKLVGEVKQQVGKKIKIMVEELTKKEKKEDQSEVLSRLTELEEEVKPEPQVEAQIKVIREELAGKQKDREALAAEVEAKQKELRDLHRRGDELEAQLSSLREQLAFWRRMQTQYEGYSEAVRALLLESPLKGKVVGVLGDLIEVDEPFVRAIETALGPYLEAIVVPEAGLVREACLLYTSPSPRD